MIKRFTLLIGMALLLAGIAQFPAVSEENVMDIEFVEAGGRRVFLAEERPDIRIEAIRIPEFDEAALLSLELLDAAGEVVRTVSLEAAEADALQARLDLSGLPLGAYQLRLGDDTAQVLDTVYLVERPTGDDFFPVVCQFGPVPSGEGWRGEESEEITPELLRTTVDNIRERGFTGLEWNMPQLSAEQADVVRNYAQAQGMVISHHIPALELFGRDDPPSIPVYSEAYGEAVREAAEQRLPILEEIPRLYNAFIYQDEPFTGGPASLSYTEYDQAEFEKCYGYPLPMSLEEARQDPQVWLDFLNFHTAKFPDAWRQIYPVVKEINPNFQVTLTHDSHNTFGAGYSSHAVIAIDDVFHWGADFTDAFVYDIYPYWNLDFRFGEPAKLPLPRMAMTHYSFAHMRNLAYHFDKDLGFWVGTFNPTWFGPYLDEGNRALHWGERLMATTAVAHGSDYLLTGFGIPTDAQHWESLGEGLRLIQKTGDYLRTTKKPQARAAMLFPRTQYLQLQEEYFNVGLSFELFQRAFGELDLIHEAQVTDAELNGYDILLLFDIKLLPEDVAQHIADFVADGGVVIADSVPHLGKLKEPMDTMEQLFGVEDAVTDRIVREGHYVPITVGGEPYWVFRDENSPDESIYTSARLQDEALGVVLDLEVISPRPGAVTTAELLAETVDGEAAILRREVGDGMVYLLGFCLQDTYFHTFKEDLPEAREQLRALLKAMCDKSGIQAQVHSSNPDIAAVIRCNDERGVLFVLNHETEDTQTRIRLGDLPFPIDRIVDVADGEVLDIDHEDGVTLDIAVPFGETRVFELLQ